MRYFDYESVAEEAGIPREKLDLICEMLRREYPDDEVAYELHVLRACNSVNDGRSTVEQLLGPVPTGASGE
jgi:hypothetical protein